MFRNVLWKLSLFAKKRPFSDDNPGDKNIRLLRWLSLWRNGFQYSVVWIYMTWWLGWYDFAVSSSLFTPPMLQDGGEGFAALLCLHNYAADLTLIFLLTRTLSFGLLNHWCCRPMGAHRSAWPSTWAGLSLAHLLDAMPIGTLHCGWRASVACCATWTDSLVP